jgi:hypothetical protein
LDLQWTTNISAKSSPGKITSNHGDLQKHLTYVSMVF